MSPTAYPGPRPDRATAQLTREAAFARLTRVRGIAIVAAGALTAAVAGIVSAASGRTLSTKHAVPAAVVTPRPVVRSRTGMPPLDNASQLGLGAPGQAPASPSAPSAAPQPQSQAPVAPQPVPAPAVSGGS